MKSKVAVIKSRPETVLADIARAAKMAGLSDFLPIDRPVILKDNISWHFPMPGVNTTPWQLEGTIETLKQSGYSDITAVHNNTVVTDPVKGSRLNGLEAVYKRHRIPELYNFRSQDVKWIRYRPKSKMLALDRIFPEGIRIPDYFIGRSIVHLPTVKCHIYTTTTGSMKNAFGGLLDSGRHRAHSCIHETLVDLLRIQKEIHPGIFTVMDGTICGNGPGPRTVLPVEKDYILASGDSVAIDAVAARMMGFDPMGLKFIRLAHEHGLGTGVFEEIDVVGEDVASVNFGFSVGHNLASRFGDAFWFSPLKKLQRLLFRTPLVHVFVHASYIYHDLLWWPVKGRKARRAVVRESKWGRLLEPSRQDRAIR
ncbi:MAG: DUF362 domain-containing protein [Planctomycetota bacterium]|nr:DUF362 domain-containing protein [Planctomycetota bacterium]